MNAQNRLFERAYRLLLRLYPKSFRDEYGHEMFLVSRDLWQSAQAKGWEATLLLSAMLVKDGIVSACQAHIEELRSEGIAMKITAKFLWLMIFTIVAALAIDYIDLHNDEIQATLMLMLPATFILGAMDFRRAWLWGGLIGLSISLSTWTAALLGVHITKMPTPLYTTLIAIVPALIGAYLGVAAQWIMQQIRTSRPAQ